MMIVTNDFLVAGVIITGLISIPVLLIVFGRMMLRIARSEAVKFKDCLSFGFKNGMWWKAIVFFITYLFGIMAGMLLFVVPGIYLFISWCAALYLLCDGKAGPIESLKQSRQLVTKAGFFRVIGYILLASLIMAALYIPFIIFPGYELLAATIQFLLIPANTMLPITLYLSITDQHPDQGETRS
ncbi:hypothetical protein [Candidatus Synchoanobacter obligatus]|uniref:Glycerophosphoryl diester phosphodiesterase membrane domain-containing protein n=1 Tax=Candidatus Synchoanobacter obligatus TaxID=2919597 RepID=A0ABT1L3L7_9GAMM|nr:hypothetical protein [Candidatus Synchoanobacter obligatus]MCP8351797.1 hypothetical protein [Candidatus Synchoanobacter obligatus]